MTDNNFNNSHSNCFNNYGQTYATIPKYETQNQIQDAFSLIKPEMYQHASIDHLNSNAFIQNDESLLFLKIKNELIPHWKDLSIESISSYIDSIISIVKQKRQFNSVMKKIEEQYNNEIKNFNYALEQNNYKMNNVLEQLNKIMNIKSNSTRQNQVYLFLKDQVNYLLNQQKEHLNIINVLKREKIKLENELQLKEINEIYLPYKNDFNCRIKDNIMVEKLNLKIDDLMKEMKDKNYTSKPQQNVNSFSNSKDSYSEKMYNDCLINVMKNISDKDKQIEILNKKIGKLNEKHIIDADKSTSRKVDNNNCETYNVNYTDDKKSININSDCKITKLNEHSNDLTKFEEILRLKKNLSKNNQK